MTSGENGAAAMGGGEGGGGGGGGGRGSNKKFSYKKLGGYLREQKGRLYIIRRCVVMLLCWRD